MGREGEIIKIAGPVVVARNMSGAIMYETVQVGGAHLIGEVVRLSGELATIQVYEETTGIRPGEPVSRTGRLLSVELGPGLLRQIYDGIQRPLSMMREASGSFIRRGVGAASLSREARWPFCPATMVGAVVEEGDIFGTVQETELVTHKVMVPSGVAGKIKEIADEGEYKVEDPIATVETSNGPREIRLIQTWPVRIPRPIKSKVAADVPLITGQRISDVFLPIAKGGTAAIPGAFGTGKTIWQHQLARWADAKVIVYVGCGERGNEMTEVLRDFPELKDPRTGKALMERTILIANTSNMPVAAREASVYTGITIAEYYRDMGYDVALMADSTSRWAEAMREVSGRLEEMPGEEGFPPYLGARLSEFYERAGRVVTLGSEERYGSISVVGAVSPSGGDFSEPVTQSTLRAVKVFWALDKNLSDRRHFPAINWLTSYSLYLENLEEWYRQDLGEDWAQMRKEAMSILQKADELAEVVRLVGPDALPEGDKVFLETARVIREDFLMQHAYDKVDSYCPLKKSRDMLEVILKFHGHMREAADKGVAIADIRETFGEPKVVVSNDVRSIPLGPNNIGEAATLYEFLARMKLFPEDELKAIIPGVYKRMEAGFRLLIDRARGEAVV